jgi:hypothetical protein
MIKAAQSSCDRIPWILANNGGKMEQSKLRRCTGMRLADLDPILVELARESRIKIDARKVVSLK